MTEKNLKLVSIIVSMVEAVLILIVGVLLIANQSFNETVCKLLGSILLVVASIGVVVSIIKDKRVLTAQSVTDAGTFAIGLVLIINGLPLAQFIMYYLIVLGAYLVLDAILDLIFKRGVASFVIKLVLAALFVVFPILYFTVDGFGATACIIIGILLIIAAALLIVQNIMLMLALNKASKADDATIDVEVKVVEAKETTEAQDNTEAKEAE